MARILSFLASYWASGRPRRRTLMTIFGVLGTGVSAGFLKQAAFGVDPYQCLCNGLHCVFPIPFGTLYLIVNLLTLILILFLDKHYVNLGTIINMIFLGYLIDATENVLAALAPVPSLGLRILYLVIGFTTLCFFASIYFTADQGVSTYDFVALYLTKNKPKSFRFVRIITDITCVLLGLAMTWKPGIGTILLALGTGPLVAFFNEKFSIPLLEGEGK